MSEYWAHVMFRRYYGDDTYGKFLSIQTYEGIDAMNMTVSDCVTAIRPLASAAPTQCVKIGLTHA
jgi:hypothetical protein